MERIQAELKDLSKEELIKRFASVEFNRFLAYYRNAPDINIYPKNDQRSKAQKVAVSGSMHRLFVNVGEMDGVTKKDFIKLLARAFNVPPTSIGHIDLSRYYLHYDVDAGFVSVIRNGIGEFTINGRRLRVDDASDRKDNKASKEDRFYDKWEKKGPKKKRF